MKLVRLTLTRRKSLLGIAFIFPWLFGFLFLFLAPLVQSVTFSFHKLVISPGGYSLEYLGFQNFREALLVDATFNRILTDSVVNMVVDAPLILFFSLFSAVLLNQSFRGRAAARAIFFLPVILASGAVSAAEASGLISMVGDANAAQEMGGATSTYNFMALEMLLIESGLPPAFSEYIFEAIGRIYEIITGSGVQILIFLAALQSVPKPMYEVAKIEGATPYEAFWKITFPMVSPLILTNIIYTIIDSFTDSEVTRTIYNTAFQTQNFGLSASMAWLYTITVSLILVVVGVLVSKRVFYNN
jgi:ABC-type sugar transport system permease subunit